MVLYKKPIVFSIGHLWFYIKTMAVQTSKANVVAVVAVVVVVVCGVVVVAMVIIVGT